MKRKGSFKKKTIKPRASGALSIGLKETFVYPVSKYESMNNIKLDNLYDKNFNTNELVLDWEEEDLCSQFL